jgi:hypothetical protein
MNTISFSVLGSVFSMGSCSTDSKHFSMQP